MLSIPISEKTTIRYSDHQESPKLNFHRLLDLYSFFATPISILIPLLMSMAFKQDTFESNSLLRFIFFAIPLSHLSLLNLRLLFSIKNSDKKSLFRSILHSVFRFLFFTFSIISILLIPMLYLNNPEDINFFSFFFLPLPISATYLLSTSCSLTPGHISFIDTGLNALVDILLLLSSLVSISICLDDEKEKFHPYLCVFLPPSSSPQVLQPEIQPISEGRRDYSLEKNLLSHYPYYFSLSLYNGRDHFIPSYFGRVL
ncbi:DUF2463 domain-containing protein [Encephalitozoon intestinalis]|nr:DUF2463 domain-containing protein [Encephalitozoon intestinalis]